MRPSEIAEFSNSRQVFKDLVEAASQGDYSLANNGIEKGLLGLQTIHGSASVFPVFLKSTPLGQSPSDDVNPSQSHTDYMQGRTVYDFGLVSSSNYSSPTPCVWTRAWEPKCMASTGLMSEEFKPHSSRSDSLQNPYRGIMLNSQYRRGYGVHSSQQNSCDIARCRNEALKLLQSNKSLSYPNNRKE